MKTHIEDIKLLRFTTAGSVDDGKSTLVGRLLYDSKQIFEDQWDAMEQASVGKGEEKVNLALLTDGLRAEREQGITIDVAYRYFATPKRKFIIADAPGHEQYTRNMITSASTANLALILIDARKGMLEQTFRHLNIAVLLQIPQVAFCINKMDLVHYDEAVFEKIKQQITTFINALSFVNTSFIPMCATDGDNIVEKSTNMPWYTGNTLMEFLESTPIIKHELSEDFRLPIQYVIRPQQKEYHDYRAFAGRIAGGTLQVGDEVTVYPSNKHSKIKAIHTFNGDLSDAQTDMSISVSFEDHIDISRGDLIVKKNHTPKQAQDIELMICWLGNTPLQNNGKYLIKHTTRDVKGIIKQIHHKVNINTFEQLPHPSEIVMNDIAKITLKTMSPLFFDAYKTNRTMGSLILIDEATNETVAAGMIM